MVLTYLTTCLTVLMVVQAHRADFDPPEHQLNRRFSWSSESPLINAINDFAPAAIPHVDFINRHYARVEAAVLASLGRQKVEKDHPIMSCDPLIRRRYRISHTMGFAMRGFPEPSWNCGTDVIGVDTGDGEPGYTTDDLYNAIFSRGFEVKKRVHDIAPRLINNFTNPEVPFNFSYSTRAARCTISPVCMFRVGPIWHQGLGIYNIGLDDYVKDGFRLSIHEHFRVVDGKLGDNLHLRLPVYDDATIERVYIDNSTTLIQRWNRNPPSSCFRTIPVEDNPAMIDALSLVDQSAQQAEDAVTNSNLAILLLPLSLNLIPIAFFADVSTISLLLYTLLSDVLTVTPLAIKGLELVLIRSKRYRSVVSRVLSPITGNRTFSIAAGGEIWGAECRVRERVGRTGIILLVTAAAFLLIGISAEILSRAYLKRRQTRRRFRLPSDGTESVRSSYASDPLLSLRIGAMGIDRDRYSDDGMER